LLLFTGRYWFLADRLYCIDAMTRFLAAPYAVPLVGVVGDPLRFEPKISAAPGGQKYEVSAEEVDEMHTRYVAALRNLFDTHKHRFGYGDRQLEIL
jgi:hypothetical protein